MVVRMAAGAARGIIMGVPNQEILATLQPPVSAFDPEPEMGPRPGELHREILQCVDCRKFMTYDKFYVTLPARECIVCKDAFLGTQRMGPLPSLQPPAPEVTPLPVPGQPPASEQPPPRQEADLAARRQKAEPFAGRGDLWIDTSGHVINDAGNTISMS
jgi:hypothetical protein